MCPPGRHSNAVGATNLSSCVACTVPGEYQDESGQTSCTPVEPGHANSGATAQIPCPRGKFGENAISGCVDCPKGWISNTSQATSCLKCGIGRSSRQAVVQNVLRVERAGTVACEGKIVRIAKRVSIERETTMIPGRVTIVLKDTTRTRLAKPRACLAFPVRPTTCWAKNRAQTA